MQLHVSCVTLGSEGVLYVAISYCSKYTYWQFVQCSSPLQTIFPYLIQHVDGRGGGGDTTDGLGSCGVKSIESHTLP